MALEIKELHIKTTITKGGANAGGGDGGTAGEQNKAQWMQECIDKVLEILAEKEER